MEERSLPGQPRRLNWWPAWAWTAASLLLTVLACVALVAGWSVNQPVLVVPVVMLAVGTTLWQLYEGMSRPPAAFVVDETRGEFAVPARLVLRASTAAWSLACLMALLVAPAAFLRSFFMGAAMGPGLLALVIRPGRGIGRLAPAGLMPGLRRAATPIPWENIVGAAVEASRPAIFGRRSAMVVGVTMVWPGRAKPRRLQWAALDIDARFLADAIEYYRTHPEHRAAIGTVDEHQRLYAALVLQHSDAGDRGRRPEHA